MTIKTDALSDEQLTEMTEEEFDSLPYGVIKLDQEGRVALYNAAEADIARRSVDSTLGKDFFKEVAPCTNVKGFRGRLDTLRDSGERTETFDFTFRFPWGTREVRIRLWIGGDGSSWVFVTPVSAPSPA